MPQKRELRNKKEKKKKKKRVAHFTAAIPKYETPGSRH